MSETNMPAAEAQGVEVPEVLDYELAFHVLPTVAEGEVTGVFDTIKALITTNGGECGLEEVPARIDLAYEVVKHLEGKNRRFTSAYFGWVRFTATAETIAAITEGVEGNKNILRHLLIKLNKKEVEQPFYYHEALAADKKVENVDAEVAPATDETPTETAEAKEEGEAKEA